MPVSNIYLLCIANLLKQVYFAISKQGIHALEQISYVIAFNPLPKSSRIPWNFWHMEVKHIKK